MGVIIRREARPFAVCFAHFITNQGNFTELCAGVSARSAPLNRATARVAYTTTQYPRNIVEIYKYSRFMLAKSPKSYGRHIKSDKIDFLTLLAILSRINYNNIMLPPSCREDWPSIGSLV